MSLSRVLGVLGLVALAAAPRTASAQQDQRMASTSGDRWFAGAYEVTCENVGNQGSQVVHVFGIARSDTAALLEARRNAVRAMLFRGVNTAVCTVPPMLQPAQLTPQADQYFDNFFNRGGLYLSYVEFAGDQVEERIPVGRDVKIGTTVIVSTGRLRQTLEEAGIIRAMGAEFGAAGSSGGGAKPSLIVFPSDIYMTQKGFMQTQPSSDGRQVSSPDYERAFLQDQGLSQVIAGISRAFQQRGYPLTDLEASLRSRRDEAAQAAVQETEVRESALDQLLSTVRPDVRLDLTFTQTFQQGRPSITFTLAALDAYSNKQVATTTGTGEPSATVPLPVLLQEAVTQRMPEFEGLLMRHFADVGANGREIRVQAQVRADAQGLEDGFETEVTSPTHSNDLMTVGELLREAIRGAAVRGVVQPGRSTNTSFEALVRIPLRNASGESLSAADWFSDVRRRLRAERIQVQVIQSQLGRIVFAIRGVTAGAAR